jgi:hypothetical protein
LKKKNKKIEFNTKTLKEISKLNSKDFLNPLSVNNLKETVFGLA